MSWIQQIGFSPGSIKALFRLRHDGLQTENSRLRRLLDQAATNAQRLKKRAGLVARENSDAARVHKVLVEELHHRAKNTLAIVMAITSQSLRNAASIEEGRVAIEARLVALGRAQDILLAAHWSSVPMSDVVKSATEPFDDKARPVFVFDIGSFELAGDAILPLTLSLNELCTNATKYGALSMPSGQVAIKATADPKSQQFKLTWSETCGPVVTQPERQGFGSRLIHLLAAQLNGKARISFEPAGVIYELDAPLRAWKAI